jgi:hypothetical protein
MIGKARLGTSAQGGLQLLGSSSRGCDVLEGQCRVLVQVSETVDLEIGCYKRG